MTNGGKERTALDLGAVATVTGLGKQRKKHLLGFTDLCIQTRVIKSDKHSVAISG